jgi:membrane protein
MRLTRRASHRAASEGAASPWRLGGLTVRELAARVWRELGDDEVLDRAAALSYFFVFALFPMLLVLTTLFGLVPGSPLVDHFMSYLAGTLPPDAFSMVSRVLAEVQRGAHGGLLSLGAVGALWAASSGMSSIMTALDAVWGVPESRSWWKRRLLALGLTGGFALFIVTGLLLLVLGPEIAAGVAQAVGLGEAFTTTWNVLRWPVAVALVLVGVGLIYALAPASRPRWRGVTPGSVVAVAGWLAAAAGLRLYVARLADYNATYGSIGGAILLLFWLYLTALVLLVGAEIDAEIAHARHAPAGCSECRAFWRALTRAEGPEAEALLGRLRRHLADARQPPSVAA